MKSKILPLLAISFGLAATGAAEAKNKVYKCKGDVEGRYTYQSKPCPENRDEPEKDELKIIPTDEEKVKAAREKLKKDLEAHKAKKEEAEGTKKPPEIQVNIPPRTTTNPQLQTTPPPLPPPAATE